MVYELKPEPPPGRALSPATVPRSADASATDVVDEDLSCVRCGYNLRGLPRTHRCPECGSAVRRSLSGHHLLETSPDWLKRITWGLGLMLWSIGSNLGSVIMLIYSTGLAYAVEWVSAGLGLVGIIYVTTSAPGSVELDRKIEVRLLVRAAAVLWFVCVASALLLIWSAWGSVLAVMNVVRGLALMAVMLGLAIYLRAFARHMDDFDLEISTTSVIWGLVVSIGVFVVFGTVSSAVSTSRTAAPASCIAIVAGAGVLFFGGWFGLLLYRYYSIVRWAAYEARLRDEADH